MLTTEASGAEGACPAECGVCLSWKHVGGSDAASRGFRKEVTSEAAEGQASRQGKKIFVTEKDPDTAGPKSPRVWGNGGAGSA